MNAVVAVSRHRRARLDLLGGCVLAGLPLCGVGAALAMAWSSGNLDAMVAGLLVPLSIVLASRP